MIKHAFFKNLDLYFKFEKNKLISIDFECETEFEECEENSKIYQEFKQYFEGRLKLFTIDYHIKHGTVFQRNVWNALLQIPYGETKSYSEVAKMIGKPKAIRAVGTAIGKNPLPILIPCHRVIRQGGQMGQYSGGIHIKQRLLEGEQHE